MSSDRKAGSEKKRPKELSMSTLVRKLIKERVIIPGWELEDYLNASPDRYNKDVYFIVFRWFDGSSKVFMDAKNGRKHYKILVEERPSP